MRRLLTGNTMSDALSSIPEITDDDIEKVRELMEIGEFDEPRRDFLKHCSTVDVSACPGSGKTTLIVAKLAILASKWPHRTSGICVLSHTNVAREQIEHRLGRSVVGQQILSYPHYIGTIHGFVNRFLALPWLNSNGYPSPTIDDDVTTSYRRRVLGRRRQLETYLCKRKSNLRELRLSDRHMGFKLSGRRFPAKPTTDSYKQAKLAIEATTTAGYFCYDEMFVWADALLEDHPEVALYLQNRFPLVIVDEMQDTCQRQACLLSTVFPRTSNKIAVQRVGDPNQQIFDTPDSSASAVEPFPDTYPTRSLEIPNSYRFGPEIAEFASPFAMQHVGSSGLCGIRPRTNGGAAQLGRHAIFVFPNNSTEGILEAYGAHALDVLGKELAAEGPVTAIGHVHKDAAEVQPGHAHYPKTVSHYWDDYSIDLSRKDPHPQTFVQYIRAAQKQASDCRNLSPGVDKIASGVIELAQRMGDIGELRRKARTHRVVITALANDTKFVEVYYEFLQEFLVQRIKLSKATWNHKKDGIIAIAKTICTGATDSAKAEEFLNWPSNDVSLGSPSAATPTDAGANIFRFIDCSGSIDIQLGSIHSVKGQTHLATLLLSTNWYSKHSADRIMPWLLGQRENGERLGPQDLQRMLHTYVAMTRPSHLLCLAIPRSAFGEDKTFNETVTGLRERGWQIAEIVEGSAQWLRATDGIT